MQEKRPTIQVRTGKVLELVQKGYALALRTDDTELKDVCTSLLAAVVPKDMKNALVRIRRIPHEQQINFINEAITGVRHVGNHDSGSA